MVCSPGECIRLAHRFPRYVVKHKVEPSKVERPPCLSAVEVFSCHEILQVLVISPDLELVFCTFNEVPPLLERPNDSQHLLVMDLIVALNWGQGLGEECNWVPFPIFW